mmetsp:Transcript_25572/g.54302  ORF Transcript_25572/g.54302 Transcript_25572/m.54302 type:complete len:80 (-) Transcript_25572:215-454(-)
MILTDVIQRRSIQRMPERERHGCCASYQPYQSNETSGIGDVVGGIKSTHVLATKIVLSCDDEKVTSLGLDTVKPIPQSK